MLHVPMGMVLLGLALCLLGCALLFAFSTTPDDDRSRVYYAGALISFIIAAASLLASISVAIVAVKS